MATGFLGPLSLTYGDKSSHRHHLATESRIAPAGNWNDEYNFRRTLSRELALKIAGSTIAQDTAHIAYQMMVCPKLEYPLAVTQFS